MLHKELRERVSCSKNQKKNSLAWCSQGMGDMEGKPGRTKGAKLALAHDETIETAAEFSHRVVGWWKRVILGQVLSRQKGSNAIGVLVATHGGVITTLTRELVGSRKVRCGDGVIIWQCMNASITVIEVDEDGQGELVRFGDVAHLQETEAPIASNADIL
jgi:probable phosphoglycerate mutase